MIIRRFRNFRSLCKAHPDMDWPTLWRIAKLGGAP